MLFHIVNEVSDDTFENIVKHLLDFYYPRKKFLKYPKELPEKTQLTNKTGPEVLEIVQKSIEKILSKCISSKNAGYPLFEFENGNIKDVKYFPFPHIELFYKLFSIRQWNQPLEDPRSSMQDLFDLEQSKSKKTNYSKNVGNFNHFVNVVVCLARLIRFFNKRENIKDTVSFEPSKDYTKVRYSDIKYDEKRGFQNV